MEWMNSPSLALTRHSSTISLSLFITMAVATFAGPMARQWQHTQHQGGLLHATNHGHRVTQGIQGVPHGQAVCFTKQLRVPGAPAGGASHWREGEGRSRATCWMPAGRELGGGRDGGRSLSAWTEMVGSGEGHVPRRTSHRGRSASTRAPRCHGVIYSRKPWQGQPQPPVQALRRMRQRRPERRHWRHGEGEWKVRKMPSSQASPPCPQGALGFRRLPGLR